MVFWRSGHGRGLIDAMAWFGCKGLLQHAIISEDKWFPHATTIHQFLSDHFKDEPSKSYFWIDMEELALKRSAG